MYGLITQNYKKYIPIWSKSSFFQIIKPEGKAVSAIGVKTFILKNEKWNKKVTWNQFHSWTISHISLMFLVGFFKSWFINHGGVQILSVAPLWIALNIAWIKIRFWLIFFFPQITTKLKSNVIWWWPILRTYLYMD